MEGQSTVNSRTKRLVIVVVLFVAFTLVASIGGSYIVGFHEGDVAALKAIHAAQVAEQGRSKSLCAALLFLATTPAAHKLHPAFVQVYRNSDCVKITGNAGP